MRKVSKEDLILTPTADMSRDDWLAFRMNGIGCSEAGTVMGYNTFMSPGELFHQKCGLIAQSKRDNPAMFWGRTLEDTVADVWQHWEWSDEEMQEGDYLENANEGNIIRKARKFNNYAQNPKYPWLFGGPDRIILNGKRGRSDSSDYGNGILEIKTIGSFHADQWELGIPPSYVIQIQSYMMLFGFDYAEIATLKDGRDFHVIRVPRSDTVQNEIEAKCSEFWNNVLLARQQIMETGDMDISDFEPEVENTKAYEEFMKTKFVVEPQTIDGTDELLEMAEQYQEYKDMEKQSKELQRGVKLQIQDIMKTADVVDLGDRGKITWKANAKDVRMFKVSLR